MLIDSETGLSFVYDTVNPNLSWGWQLHEDDQQRFLHKTRLESGKTSFSIVNIGVTSI